MSREKDSAIVYELVTSKYKIAERNRLAKFRFLSGLRNGTATKRRDSEPTVANTEKTNVRSMDLSVPGTPVSSRVIESLKKLRRGGPIESDSENEGEDYVDGATDKQAILTEGLKKFTADMEKLQDDVSHDPLRKYFEDSDKKKTYRRDFSEVVAEFPIKKSEPETVAKVEKYFQESERMNSFKRDFSEVVKTFDPKNPSGREQFTDLHKIGTPISSRLIAVEKLSSAIENEPVSGNKNSNEVAECDINSQVQLNSNGITRKPDDVTVNEKVICEPKASGNASLIIENDESSGRVEGQVENVVTKLNEKDSSVVEVVDDAQEKVKPDPPHRVERSDSTASNISVPGTPISSRDLPTARNGRNFIDTDDSGSEDEEGKFSNENSKITELAKEFVQEIENLVQKSFDDDDRQEIVLKELKKITSENGDGSVKNENISAPTSKGESDGKLIIHEEQQNEANPDGSASKIEAYFKQSEKENTFRRTFSEVESFNKVSADVKQKVDNYFRESDQKKSLTRPFSQVVNYVEPKVDVNQLLKPGTPVSSAVVMCLKKQAQSQSQQSINEDEEADPESLEGQQAFKKAHEALRDARKTSLKVEDYFQQSTERKTYRRDFSEVLQQLNKAETDKNPEIEKYFEQSDAQQSFQRPFSEVFQSVPPRIEDILKVEEKVESKPLHYQRSSRASSVSSTGSDFSESGLPKKAKKHGKKYGIDKYFATSLYRTAYHRSNSRRQSADGEIDGENELKIVEDEDVFGESDMLRQHDFQHDDETRVTENVNDVNENQTVTFWRDFLKPYNLNLQTEIKLTKDDLLNNRTLE